MSKREPKTVTYKNDEVDYACLFTQLSPSKSLIFMMYLGKMLGGSAGKVIGAFNGSSLQEISGLKEENINLEKIGDAIFGLFARLDEEEVINKLNLLFSSVSLNGETLDVDHLMFQGEPGLIFKVAKKALEVNYKSFLDGNSGLIGKITKTLKIVKGSKESPTEQM